MKSAIKNSQRLLKITSGQVTMKSAIKNSQRLLKINREYGFRGKLVNFTFLFFINKLFT